MIVAPSGEGGPPSPSTIGRSVRVTRKRPSTLDVPATEAIAAHPAAAAEAAAAAGTTGAAAAAATADTLAAAGARAANTAADLIQLRVCEHGRTWAVVLFGICVLGHSSLPNVG